MAPLKVQVKSVTGQQAEYTIIGVFDIAPAYSGMLVSSAGGARVGASSPSRYVLRLAEGADDAAMARQIERAFRAEGVQTTLLVKQIEDARAGTVSTFYLIQAFIALGLLVGIAALGVLAVRSVVERRQQIGMLRAIGFEQGMVQGTFLLDSMFVATLGIVIGFVLGLSFAYNLYTQVVADQGLSFDPPWPTLALVVGGAFAASLLMTFFPARNAARTTIATALRYE
jgi:putative ABC transport system permease protein